MAVTAISQSVLGREQETNWERTSDEAGGLLLGSEFLGIGRELGWERGATRVRISLWVQSATPVVLTVFLSVILGPSLGFQLNSRVWSQMYFEHLKNGLVPPTGASSGRYYGKTCVCAGRAAGSAWTCPQASWGPELTRAEAPRMRKDNPFERERGLDLGAWILRDICTV